jgi:hypothetical protein
VKSVSEVFKQVNDDASAAHLAHLNTKSYAHHIALGAFYDDVREKMDTLLEAMIASGAPTIAPTNPLEVFEAAHADLLKQRAAVTGEDCVLEMHFDEVLNCYLKAIYMLRMK